MQKVLTQADIIADEKDFVLFYKPAGMNFHCEDGEQGFVVLAQELLSTNELYSVHRLDKMTSGLILLTKSSESANKFATMFEERKIEKFYLAISTRKPKKKQGWIKADMVPSRRGSYKLLQTKNNPAITQFLSTSTRPNERLFLIKPHTGKTHQIRVALKSIGAPVAGDIRYADATVAKKEERGYLHAYGLHFTFENKEYSYIVAPREGERFCTNDLREILQEKYQKPWGLF
ncbi:MULTISPECIES: TIGR01621 family pseudouridine synthase [Sulfurimonas]|uniref:TIGR01621 family pseudouridine synthase n=1 Tax=Sulfurimonas TaxID=202746 RepID=UPI00126537C0|nr:TIGR01621 family pseudouridine synthase [Sulfurimonas indica]